MKVFNYEHLLIYHNDYKWVIVGFLIILHWTVIIVPMSWYYFGKCTITTKLENVIHTNEMKKDEWTAIRRLYLHTHFYIFNKR